MTDVLPNRTLNDGTIIPAVGFGTFQLRGAEGVETMVRALHSGYRLLDSAFNYENEGAVGEALRLSGLPRNQVRIASKLPGRHHVYKEALSTVEESVYRSRVDQFDLYLIHWPNPKVGLYVEAWQALIEARKRGLVRSIGVCNFLPEHLDRLVAETGVTPCINQIEMHPYFPQTELCRYNDAHGIVTVAWSPLGRAGTLLNEPVLKSLAAAKGRSAGQVVLRWHHQLGAVPLPKASSEKRQIENRSLSDFDLSDADMQQVATLARQDGRLANQDPANYEEL